MTSIGTGNRKEKQSGGDRIEKRAEKVKATRGVVQRMGAMGTEATVIIVIFVYSHAIVVKKITYIIINITHIYIYTYIRVRIWICIYIDICIYSTR